MVGSLTTNLSFRNNHVDYYRSTTALRRCNPILVVVDTVVNVPYVLLLDPASDHIFGMVRINLSFAIGDKYDTNQFAGLAFVHDRSWSGT